MYPCWARRKRLMPLFKLSPRACARLRDIARNSPNAREVRRAQALLWVHEGTRVRTVARRLSVSRRTVRRWIGRYRERAVLPVKERIQEGQHTGRLATQLKRAQKVIEKVWPRDPRRYGFRALNWTVPMLRCLLHRRLDEWISRSTMRRALRSLRYRYKRPRLVLARRAATWRQAKGGLNAG